MTPRLAVLPLLLLALVPGLGAGPSRPQVAEPVNADAVARIREEGLRRSEVMDTAFWLTDRYGPRLHGSPESEEAGEWAMARLRAWGVSNVRQERFPAGRGWSLLNFHATMTEPRAMPIIGVPRAWTPGTPGIVSAEVVRPIIATAVDAERYRGTLRGKIVLLQPARPVRMLEQGDGTVLRYDDQGGRWRAEALTPDTPESEVEPVSLSTGRAPGPVSTAAPFNLLTFYRQEGVLALFDRGDASDLASGGSDLTWVQQRPDGGTLFVQAGAAPTTAAAETLPQVTLAVEHYNRMVRLIEHGVPVKAELNIAVRETPETRPGGFNILGEIPGSDLAAEVVLIGAHFDSWHGGTGATDNAAGVAAMMEVLRIIRATGLQPRRTIRIGLWGNEEGGLVGSSTYVREHLGTRAEPKPELARISAYFNLDNGTGPIRGVWMQGNTAVRPIFEAWSAPVRDLGVDLFSPRRVPSTDHGAFDAVGVPAFQFVQERYEYNSRTHHSNMDVYDRLQPDDLKQMATVAAVFAWQAATRDGLLPRRTDGSSRVR